MTLKRLLAFGVLIACVIIADAAQFGLYLTEATASKTSRLKQLIKQSKQAGINTLIIDYAYNNSRFVKNLKLVKQSGLHYVARIVVFNHGGTYAQVHNPSYWQKPYRYVKKAMQAGADAIQLDYIRYNTRARRSKQNAKDIHKVIIWYKQHINVPLEVDVFGMATHKPAQTIGQNLNIFAKTVDFICPMVYPSHYFPYDYHGRHPYRTIMKSMRLLDKQFGDQHGHVKIIPWLEAYNFRRRMSRSARMAYIWDQIRAAKDSGSDGYYIWSAKNQYRNLFAILKSKGKPW
jgi:hypothetical protein